MIEHSVECPFCGEEIVILVDSSEDLQAYIEDCSVCCRPIHLTIACADGELVSVSAERG